MARPEVIGEKETLDEFLQRWTLAGQSLTIDRLVADNPQADEDTLRGLVGKAGLHGRIRRFGIDRLNVPVDAAKARRHPPPPKFHAYSNPGLDWLTYETLFNTRFTDQKDFRKPNGAFKLGLFTIPLDKVDIWVRKDTPGPLLDALRSAFLPDFQSNEQLIHFSNLTWPWRKGDVTPQKIGQPDAESQGSNSANRAKIILHLSGKAVIPYNYFDNKDTNSCAIGTKEQDNGIKRLKDQHFWYAWKTASRSLVSRTRRIKSEKGLWREDELENWEIWPFDGSHRIKTGLRNPDHSDVGDEPSKGHGFSHVMRKLGDVSVKVGVQYIGSEAQAKKDINEEWLLGCLRSDYVQRIEEQPEFPKDDFIVLTELLTIVEKEVRDHPSKSVGKYRDGVQVRDISRLRGERCYFPPLTIPQIDLSFTTSTAPFAMLYRDWNDPEATRWRLFWKKCWAAQLGRVKALMLLRYGIQVQNPNVQNYLIEFDRDFLRNVPDDFFNDGASLGPVRFVVRDLGDASFHREALWAMHGGAGAAPTGPDAYQQIAALGDPLFAFEFGTLLGPPAPSEYTGNKPQETGTTDEQFGEPGLQLLWQRFSATTNGTKPALASDWKLISGPLMAMSAEWGVAHNKAYISTLEHETGHKFTDIPWQDVHDPMQCDTDNLDDCQREATTHFVWEEGVSRLLQRWMEDPDGGIKAIRDYKDRKWKPPGGVVATVILTGATGNPVPWRPVRLYSATLDKEWTDVTDHAGQVAIPGRAAADISVRSVSTGVGHAAADRSVAHVVA